MLQPVPYMREERLWRRDDGGRRVAVLWRRCSDACSASRAPALVLLFLLCFSCFLLSPFTLLKRHYLPASTSFIPYSFCAQPLILFENIVLLLAHTHAHMPSSIKIPIAFQPQRAHVYMRACMYMHVPIAVVNAKLPRIL